MSDNYFQENRKFLGIKGILGRRDFIINYLIIELIDVLLWTLPLTVMVFFKPSLLSDMLDSALSVPSNQPFAVVLGMAILGLIIVPLYFSSIVRRVRDILGEEDENRVYLVSSVLSVICYISYTPVGSYLLGKWLVIFVFLILMSWEGKITSKKPASEIIKFNGGAFWGTWIWGLFNKIPVTLFAIPLVFTLGIFPFMLICGLKGNEWLYNKQKENMDLETFHRTQETESVIFTILAPVIVLVGLLFPVVTVSAGLVTFIKASPAFAKKFETFIISNEESFVKNTFSPIELGEDEYKFFLNPMTWNEETQYTRVSAFKTVVNYVILQKDGEKLNKVGGGVNLLLKKNADKYDIDKIRRYVEVANKTKIYSSFNNEVLAEYHIETSDYEEALKNLKTTKDVKNLYKILDSGYKFNEHPSIP